MKLQTYKCDKCGEEFISGWSNAEAEAELNELFPGEDRANCNTLCDNCFQQLMAQIQIT